MRATLLVISTALLLAGCGEDTVAPPPTADPIPDFEIAWGGHGAGSGQFHEPSAIATGPDGSVYVLDNQNTRVQKFTNDGVFVRSWGDSIAPAFSSLLRGVAVSADRVYVSDLGTAYTYVYTTEGDFIDKWDYISMDSGLAVDPEGNVVLSGYQVLRRGYILELLGPYVWRLDPEGHALARWTMNILQVAVDKQGNLYGVSTKFEENGEPRGFVLKFSAAGVFLAKFGTPDRISVYDAVAVDSQGDVYVADRPDGSIYRFAPDGTLLATWSYVADSEPLLNWPAGLAIDADDDLFATDFMLDRVVKWTGSPVR
jgi:DNA-binding beta-propeller fold protein YncE